MSYQMDDYHDDLETFSMTSNYDGEKALEETRLSDRGYNVIYRKAVRSNGRIYDKKIKVYTTSGVGSNIRDAETGQYYPNFVGSKDEDLFFKVILATGECKSANKSSTLFYLSPQHYVNHLLSDVSEEIINKWQVKNQARLNELKINAKSNLSYIEVK